MTAAEAQFVGGEGGRPLRHPWGVHGNARRAEELGHVALVVGVEIVAAKRPVILAARVGGVVFVDDPHLRHDGEIGFGLAKHDRVRRPVLHALDLGADRPERLAVVANPLMRDAIDHDAVEVGNHLRLPRAAPWRCRGLTAAIDGQRARHASQVVAHRPLLDNPVIAGDVGRVCGKLGRRTAERRDRLLAGVDVFVELVVGPIRQRRLAGDPGHTKRPLIVAVAVFLEGHHLEDVVLLDVGQDERRPSGSHLELRRHRKSLAGIMEAERRQGHRLQVVLAAHPPRRLPRRLDRRQEQADQRGDDRDHHEKLHEREPPGSSPTEPTGDDPDSASMIQHVVHFLAPSKGMSKSKVFGSPLRTTARSGVVLGAS